MDFCSAISHSSSRPLEKEIYIPPVKAADRQLRESTIDVTSFGHDGFSDFELDLDCLSNPPSPPDSARGSFSDVDLGNHHQVLTAALLPLITHSPSSLTTAQLQAYSQEQQKRTSQCLPSPRHSPATSPQIARNSLPAIRYTGRGTPVNQARRSQWASTHTGVGESDAGRIVGEDGTLLFSQTRSGSLDSTSRPSNHSVSSDWNFICPSPSNMTGIGAGVESAATTTTATHASPSWLPPSRGIDPLITRSRSRSGTMAATAPFVMTSIVTLEPLPESSKIKVDVESDPSEWDSLMQTVLGSGSASRSDSPVREEDEERDETVEETTPTQAPSEPELHALSPPEMEEVNGLMNLGSVPDLVLGLRATASSQWFDAGDALLPPRRRRPSTVDSPSVYSTPPATPRASNEDQRGELPEAKASVTAATSEVTVPPPATASNPLIRMMRRPSRAGIEPPTTSLRGARSMPSKTKEHLDPHWWQKVLHSLRKFLRSQHRPHA